MEYVDVQGERVPALGLGTWRLTGADCRRAVEVALELGYRHIDTAQMYGNEDEVGAAIEASGVDHGELFVTTKIANDNHRPDDVRRSTEQSLERLRLDTVDLLLIHHPVEAEILSDTLAAMKELRERGLVRHLGVSNFGLDLLGRALDEAPLFAVQLEYHPFRSQDGQLAAARDHDLLFQAYSPLARSGVAGQDELEAVAAGVGATAAQVALRWLIDQPKVAAIPKASSRDHLSENLEALDVRLDDEAHRRIDALTASERSASDLGV